VRAEDDFEDWQKQKPGICVVSNVDVECGNPDCEVEYFSSIQEAMDKCPYFGIIVKARDTPYEENVAIRNSIGWLAGSDETVVVEGSLDWTCAKEGFYIENITFSHMEKRESWGRHITQMIRDHEVKLKCEKERLINEMTAYIEAGRIALKRLREHATNILDKDLFISESIERRQTNCLLPETLEGVDTPSQREIWMDDVVGLSNFMLTFENGKFTVSPTEPSNDEIEWYVDEDTSEFEKAMIHRSDGESLRACVVNCDEFDETMPLFGIHLFDTIQSAFDNCPFPGVIIEPCKIPYFENLVFRAHIEWVGGDSSDKRPTVIGLHDLTLVENSMTLQSIHFVRSDKKDAPLFEVVDE